MKRYDIDIDHSGYNDFTINELESTDGEWVKYTDIPKHSEELKEAYLNIVGTWEQSTGDCDEKYCVHCFWDEYEKKHDEDCIVLKAETYLKSIKEGK